jgi:hypothetical protein
MTSKQHLIESLLAAWRLAFAAHDWPKAREVFALIKQVRAR